MKDNNKNKSLASKEIENIIQTQKERISYLEEQGNINEIDIARLEDMLSQTRENYLLYDGIIEYVDKPIIVINNDRLVFYISDSCKKYINLTYAHPLEVGFATDIARIFEQFEYSNQINVTKELETNTGHLVNLTYLKSITIENEKFVVIELSPSEKGRIPKDAFEEAVQILNIPIYIFSDSGIQVFSNAISNQYLTADCLSSYSGMRFSLSQIEVYVRDLLSHNLLLSAKYWQESVGIYFDGIRSEFLLDIRSISSNDKTYYLLALFNLETSMDDKSYFRDTYYDKLTKLPNRTYIFSYLQSLLSKEKIDYTCVINMDVDNFQTINDAYGHKVGDYVLQTLGSRLVSLLKEEDFISRSGGDEFIVVLSSAKNERAATIILDNMIKELSRPILYSDLEIDVTLSFGVVVVTRKHKNTDKIIERSDNALFYAKAHGKNQYAFYNDGMQDRLEYRNMLNNLIHATIKNPEEHLSIIAEPVVVSKNDGVKNEVLCYECLSRFTYNGKRINPEELIVYAEEEHLMHRLGEALLRRTFLGIERYTKAHPQAYFSINISSKQLVEDHFADYIISMIGEYEINPKQIYFELTETAAYHYEMIEKNMHRINKFGIKFFLDDFGSGYASLLAFYKLPLYAIKIDKELTRDVIANKGMEIIVEKIISIIRALDYEIIIEGIETGEQLQWFKHHKTENFQGYFWKEMLFTLI